MDMNALSETKFGVHENILTLIGNTPIVKLNRISSPGTATIYAKLEWFNIGGSIKDRIVLKMFQKALESGKLSKDRMIIEATSGNTGIALAMVAAVYGYKVVIIMPENGSIERRKIMSTYGAQLMLSPASEGTAGAIDLKNRMVRERPELYVPFDQFSDPANYMAHYETTAREIQEQMGDSVNAIVTGVGTGGTGVGLSMRLKARDPSIMMVGVYPEPSFKIPGLRNPEERNPSKVYSQSRFDRIYRIGEDDKKRIVRMIREVASKEGLLVGISSAATLCIAKKLARELGNGKNVLAILADNGMKYLSTDYFDGGDVGTGKDECLDAPVDG